MFKKTDPLSGLSRKEWKSLFKPQNNVMKLLSEKKARVSIKKIKLITESEALKILNKLK